GGWLFRRELEGLWCSFPSLREAVLAARDICRAEGAGLFGFRFGLHYGDVTITAEGDVLGNVLSLAKRLETATSPGCLLISQEAAERVGEFELEEPHRLELKGLGAVEARRLVLAEFSLADSLLDEDWQALERGELLVCLVGPLGGPQELEGLWGLPFYEAAQDREAEVGRPQLLEEFQAWRRQIPPLLAAWSAPTLCFFPETRLEHALCLAPEVLTEEDLDEFWSGLAGQLQGWETALTTHRIFWVGPADWIEDFYRELRRRFPAGPQQRQFVLDLGDGTAAARWRKRGLPVFSGRQQLVELLGRVGGRDEAVSLPLAERPYLFLDAYGPAERSIFFGRERESALLYSWILTRRWLVLYGRSGVGKSSLLGAGVLPLLQESGCQVWTLRCLDDPLQQLESFARVCRAAETTPRRLVLFFDQFEEFFVRLEPAQRQALGELLAQLTSVSRLHMLFSLREDFLAELAALEEWIPTLLDSRYRLTALTREQARQCICGPAELFKLPLQPELVEELLNELESQGVEPPELQIVMDRLWQLREHGEIGLEDYRRLGGVRSILLDYLHEAMQGWSDEKPRQLLSALVSERGTKQAMTLASLRARVAEPEAALQALVESRLVRTVQNYFELCHEYLIEEIQSWADHEELARRHAEMVLHSELESWENLHSLITPERLAMVAQQLPHLNPSESEWKLLLRAAMVRGVELPKLGPRPQELLIKILDEGWDGWVQRRVLEQLAELPLEGRAQQRYLEAARLFSNPGLLERVRPKLDPRFGEQLALATRRRFFAPMAYVPAGPALLGSDAANREQRKARLPRYWHARIDSERPLERVEVGSFWVDRTPVTNLQFAEFRPAHIDRYPDEEDHHPVVSVSWHDAQAYAQWLGKELICETRWEKAARGVDGRLFPWGNVYHAGRLNGQEDGPRTTTEVGKYPEGASPYGCLDMAGNVWEWTASSWSEGGPFKVQKGGSTLNPAPLQQASSRQEAFPDFVLQWVGFRLMSLEGP
ncbi:MAG: SUMF1/EgtB/PvdO family nonheme iron enzyme, partial [Candidatus Eremiobacteraeota bacterium]|nr:SUMF1/EgtB/PvdO family nonheme iron enzyme [Candidatus Eremiobacteraeota bacterium]